LLVALTLLLLARPPAAHRPLQADLGRRAALCRAARRRDGLRSAPARCRVRVRAAVRDQGLGAQRRDAWDRHARARARRAARVPPAAGRRQRASLVRFYYPFRSFRRRRSFVRPARRRRLSPAPTTRRLEADLPSSSTASPRSLYALDAPAYAPTSSGTRTFSRGAARGPPRRSHGGPARGRCARRREGSGAGGREGAGAVDHERGHTSDLVTFPLRAALAQERREPRELSSREPRNG